MLITCYVAVPVLGLYQSCRVGESTSFYEMRAVNLSLTNFLKPHSSEVDVLRFEQRSCSDPWPWLLPLSYCAFDLQL